MFAEMGSMSPTMTNTVILVMLLVALLSADWNPAGVALTNRIILQSVLLSVETESDKLFGENSVTTGTSSMATAAAISANLRKTGDALLKVDNVSSLAICLLAETRFLRWN